MNFKKFKGASKKTGYLFIPDLWLKFGYQKHGALALFLSVPLTIYLTVEWFQNDTLSALVSSVIIYVFGWLIELTHKLKPHRHFDPYDAHIMLLLALFGSFLIVLLRSVFYH